MGKVDFWVSLVERHSRQCRVEGGFEDFDDTSRQKREGANHVETT